MLWNMSSLVFVLCLAHKTRVIPEQRNVCDCVSDRFVMGPGRINLLVEDITGGFKRSAM